MQLFVSILIVLCFVPNQEEQSSDPSDRLSPPRMGRRTFKPHEVPKFLDDRFAVSDPEKVLAELEKVQQKAWSDLKTIKGRAWMSFLFENGESRGTMVLLETSLARNPRSQKQLVYYLKDAFEKRKDGKVPFGGGVDPDAKDQMICLNATIRTPEMMARGHFLSHLRDDSLEILEVYPADSNQRHFLDFENLIFRYPGSPKEFFEKTLPEKKKRNYEVKVKANAELVELALWHPNVPNRPTNIWLFDLSKRGSAVFTFTLSETHETEFEKVGESWLPKRVVLTSKPKHSDTKFFDWVLNQEFDENEFAIGSMPALDTTRVHDKRTGKKARFKTFKK